MAECSSPLSGRAFYEPPKSKDTRGETMRGRICALALSTAMVSVVPAPAAATQGAVGSNSGSAATALLSWAPLLILIVLWFVFAKYLKKSQAMQQRGSQHMDRVESLLERIADAVESRKQDE